MIYFYFYCYWFTFWFILYWFNFTFWAKHQNCTKKVYTQSIPFPPWPFYPLPPTPCTELNKLVSGLFLWLFTKISKYMTTFSLLIEKVVCYQYSCTLFFKHWISWKSLRVNAQKSVCHFSQLRSPLPCGCTHTSLPLSSAGQLGGSQHFTMWAVPQWVNSVFVIF